MNNIGRVVFRDRFMYSEQRREVVFRDKFMYSEQGREGWSSETGSCTVNKEGRGGLQRQVHVQ